MREMDILKLLFQLAGNMENCEQFDEFLKLDKMLTAAGIPFKNFGMQICYYGKEGHPKPESNTIFQGPGVGAVCSVIANGYGSDEGLLEISGLMTREEVETNKNTVLGHLTADDVFKRIEQHYHSV